MEATFSIDPDVSCGVLRITMAGFFEAADIARFAGAVRDGLAALRMRPNGHLTLVDIRDMDIQAQDSVTGFQQILSDPRTASPRIAFVVARSLSSMQIRRAAKGREAGYFNDPAAAEAWLLEARTPSSRRLRIGAG